MCVRAFCLCISVVSNLRTCLELVSILESGFIRCTSFDDVIDTVARPLHVHIYGTFE